jgi:two-component system alkaline phosphatase synthesis response regulator PhoP
MSRPRILVVDDEQHIVSLLSMTLRKAGYEVITASNGSKALALCEAFAFDLVILDQAMPGMDGVELASKLADGLPVLMITARPQTVQQNTPRIGEVIHKPFSPREVTAKVEALIGRGNPPKEQTA